MHNTKFITLLKGLDNLELKHFVDFVASPFFNKDKRLVKVVSLLRKHHPEYSARTLVKEKVFAKLFPSEKISLSLQNKLLHTLNSLLEDFLVWNCLNKKEVQRDLLLLESFREKGMDKLFFSFADKLSVRLEGEQTIDLNKFYDRYYLNYLIYGHQNFPRAKGHEYFRKFNENLDWFFLGSKYKIIAAAGSLRQLFEDKNPQLRTEFLFKAMEGREHSSPNLIRIYHDLSKAFLVPPTSENYYNLKEFVTNNIFEFENEKTDIYQLLFNYAFVCPLGAEKEAELFSIYLFGLEHGFLLEDNYIQEVNFNNIIVLACLQKKFEWAEAFLQKDIHLIHPSRQDNVQIYSDAYISYSMGNYTEAIGKLMNTDLELTSVFYILNAKTIIIKSFYMMDDLDNFFRSLDAFGVYLRRNSFKVAAPLQQKYLMFTRLLKKIYQEKYDKQSLKEIRSDINSIPASKLESKEWLLERIEAVLT